MKPWIAFTLTAALIAGCKDKDDEKAAAAKKQEKPSRVSKNEEGDTVITLTKEEQAKIGIKTDELDDSTLQPESLAYGALAEDPSRVFSLRAPLAGVLRAAKWPGLGDVLADGAPVADIEPRFAPLDRVDLTARLVLAQSEVIGAESSLAAAKAALDRAEELRKDQNISQRALDDAKAKFISETAHLKAATLTVEILTAALQGTARIAIPLDRGGEVTEVLARPGEAVESGQELLRFAVYDSLLARVELPCGEIVDGASARIVVAGRDEVLKGERVAWTAGDARTRGQAFIFRVSTKELRPGLAVTAYIAAKGEPLKGVVIPRAAVIRYAGKMWAYVQDGDAFEREELIDAKPVADGWFVTSKFEEKQKVVIGGAQTVLSEELKSQIAED